MIAPVAVPERENPYSQDGMLGVGEGHLVREERNNRPSSLFCLQRFDVPEVARALPYG